jgi:hypothetical protein
MRKASLTAAAFAAAMLMSGTVLAQYMGNGAGTWGPGWHHRHGGMGPHGGMIDQNGNGVIEQDEAASLAQNAFERMDTNSDGALSKDEYKTGLLRFGPGHGHRHQQLDSLSETRFKQMDKNNDGKVEYGEYMDGAQQALAAADLDKNGTVTPWEFRRTHPHHH